VNTFENGFEITISTDVGVSRINPSSSTQSLHVNWSSKITLFQPNTKISLPVLLSLPGTITSLIEYDCTISSAEL
jgi:hypothetical protein